MNDSEEYEKDSFLERISVEELQHLLSDWDINRSIACSDCWFSEGAKSVKPRAKCES